MNGIQVKSRPLLKKRMSSSVIQTSLYELMETVIDVADPNEKRLVNEVTINILAKAKPRVRVADWRIFEERNVELIFKRPKNVEVVYWN